MPRLGSRVRVSFSALGRSNGGIGRHEGLKILWPVMAVWVQVPLRVHNPTQTYQQFLHKGNCFFCAVRKAQCRTLPATRAWEVRSHCKRNVPHVARNVWLSGFQMFVLIANAMYRTLLATCGSAVFQMFVLIEIVINEPTFPLSHTLRATCGTLHFR